MRITSLKYIYRITNPIGEFYIGQTIDWENRFYSYKTQPKKEQRLLYKSLKKYTWEGHKKEIIELCSEEIIDSREIFHIKNEKSYYKDNPLGLNLTRGGRDCISDNNIEILQYSLNGEFIKEWKSATQVVDELCLKTTAAISLVLTGVNKSAHGFMWRYKINENYSLKIDKISKKKVKKGYKHTKPSKQRKVILQYTLFGEFIKQWESLKEAAFSVGLKKSTTITNCAKGKFTNAKGYQWKYKEGDIAIKIAPVDTSKMKYTFKYNAIQIKCTNLRTNKIDFYDTIENCAKDKNIDFTQIYRVIKNNGGIAINKKLKFEIIEQQSNSIT